MATINYITVTGTYLNPDKVTPKTGYVEFRPNVPLTVSDGGLLVSDPLRATLDASGTFTIDIIACDNIDVFPYGWYWVVDEKIINGTVWYLMAYTPEGGGRNPLDISNAYRPVGVSDQPPTVVQPGPAGVKGDQGTVSVNSTITGEPGTQAIVIDLNPASTDATLQFIIPKGDKGDKGDTGHLTGVGIPEIYAQPAEPADLAANVLWVDIDDIGGTSGVGGTVAEIYTQPDPPASTGNNLLWVDTDDTSTVPPPGGEGSGGIVSVYEIGDALQRIAVPSYFWVTWYNAVGGDHSWERMQSAAPYQDIAVCNPSSGSGASINLDWVTQITNAHAAGLKIVGYVKTDYTNITLAAAKADIDNYYAWYNVDGIFLDECGWEAAKIPYYADLYAYIKSKNGKVVINPGIPGIDEGYMAVCDIVMNFEGYATAYLSQTFPAWTIKYPSNKFWHCIHDVVDISQRDALLVKSLANRAGHIYMTTDTFAGNPYDSLPTDPFWSGMVNKIKNIPPIASGTSAPSSPAVGDLWADPN